MFSRSLFVLFVLTLFILGGCRSAYNNRVDLSNIQIVTPSQRDNQMVQQGINPAKRPSYDEYMHSDEKKKKFNFND